MDLHVLRCPEYDLIISTKYLPVCLSACDASIFALLKQKLMDGMACIIFNYGPTSGGVVTLKTGRREVPGSNPGRACRTIRSEFSVVFSA